MPIRTRVNLAFAVAVGVLLAIAAASYQSVSSLAETGQWIGHTYEVLAAIDAVASATTTAEAGTRGYAHTAEERFLEADKSGARSVDVALATLRRLTADNPAAQGRVDRLEPLPREHLARLADTVALRRDQSGAAERAARLTHQLLAFSRKQVLEPRVLDLNETVTGIEPLLRRLTGEDIEIAVTRGSELGRVKADAGQVEQVILNLAVNARDAMPHGGRLVLETANVTVDERAARRAHDVAPGGYVVLSVTDSGHGMDAATRAQIFEPFLPPRKLARAPGSGWRRCTAS